MTCAGEEATVIGSAAGLDPQDQVGAAMFDRSNVEDPTLACSSRDRLLPTTFCTCLHSTLLQVFAQYREQGVLLWRGFSFTDFANQVRSCDEGGGPCCKGGGFVNCRALALL